MSIKNNIIKAIAASALTLYSCGSGNGITGPDMNDKIKEIYSEQYYPHDLWLDSQKGIGATWDFYLYGRILNNTPEGTGERKPVAQFYTIDTNGERLNSYDKQDHVGLLGTNLIILENGSLGLDGLVNEILPGEEAFHLVSFRDVYVGPNSNGMRYLWDFRVPTGDSLDER